MPTFDPTKPAANSLVSSAELRDQLNALNDSLATTTALANTTSDQVKDIRDNIFNLSPLTTTYTDPVSAANVERFQK